MQTTTLIERLPMNWDDGFGDGWDRLDINPVKCWSEMFADWLGREYPELSLCGNEIIGPVSFVRHVENGDPETMYQEFQDEIGERWADKIVDWATRMTGGDSDMQKMKMTTKRAQKGGEVAPNGEFYKGGQFINTIEENPKRAARPRRVRRVEVEPCKWEAGRDDEFPIFQIIGTVAAWVDRYDTSKGIQPHTAGIEFYGDNWKGHKVVDLCERWNNGERWIRWTKKN